ncbi:MAG: histidinol-phosphatase HisJ family protein [Candidatus Thorarchaeota archaeon]
MFDYHIHPNYSIDAEGSIEEYCEEALRKGLKEIAFTTHLDTNSIADDCYVNIRGKKVSTRSSVWLVDYEASIKSADDKYQERGLRVRLGVEVDYIPEIDGTLPENFHSTEFDVILGSMHLIDHIAISDGRAEQAFKRYTMEEMGYKYYTHLQNAIESNLFDIVAHIDLYRRFGQAYYGDEIRDIWKPHISDLANAMNTHSVGFEVNTSALRRGQSQPMPEASIINELKVEGVSTVTVGSDAHRPQDIGSDFEIAFRMLRDAGFSDISLFEKRKIRKHKIPY